MTLPPTSDRPPPRAWSRPWLALAVAAVMVGGCDFVGLPNPHSADAQLSVDAGADASPRICPPFQRTCINGKVQSCSPDGTRFSYEDCPPASTCQDGICRAIRDRCTPRTGGNPPPFSISPTTLVFETGDNAKSQRGSLQITNCTDYPLTLDQLRILPSAYRRQNSGFDAMFNFAPDSKNLAGLDLARRDSSTTVELIYQPQYGLSRLPATLELQLVGQEPRQVDVALRPETDCLTTTPTVSAGFVSVGAQATSTMVVQNCGSEPIGLTGVDVGPTTPDSQANADVSLTLPDQLPTLDAGEHLDLPVSITGVHRGRAAYVASVEVAGRTQVADSALTTAITADVTADTCNTAAVGPPTVDGPELAHPTAWKARQMGLDAQISVRANPESIAGQTRFKLHPPTASRSRLARVEGAADERLERVFRPDVAGTYQIEVQQIDDDGQLACEPGLFEFEVVPAADLYVDLRWTTRDDPIADDVGYGRGVDLNLHLASTAALDTTPRWTDPVRGCFGFGQYPAADDGVHSRRFGCIGPDETVRSHIDALSISGAHREVISVDDAGDDIYFIGVQSWSSYTYSRASAQLSIYADGQRVDDVQLPAMWWSRATPPTAELDDLLTQTMAPQKVWIFGAWDAANHRLLAYPPELLPAFP